MVNKLYRITRTQGDKLKKFTYSPCSIINNSINTHEIHKCPRGEIGRHKGLKKPWVRTSKLQRNLKNI